MILRSIFSATALVAGYYLVPLGGPRDGDAAFRLGLVLVAVALLAGASIRSVQRSKHPTLRAAESIALMVPIVIVGFGSAYGAISSADVDAFSERLDHTAALYLSLATATTVGFGDIAAMSDVARAAAMVQMVSNVVVIGVISRTLLAVARKSSEALVDDSAGISASGDGP